MMLKQDARNRLDERVSLNHEKRNDVEKCLSFDTLILLSVVARHHVLQQEHY